MRSVGTCRWLCFFFSSRRRHTRFDCDWSSDVCSSDLRFLVVGERLCSFAAFLGRPFREYDFYLGIYDALSFFAREACRGSGTDSPCVERRLHDLVETNALDWGADRLPRTVLRSLYQREWQGAGNTTVTPRGGAAAPRGGLGARRES